MWAPSNPLRACIERHRGGGIPLRSSYLTAIWGPPSSAAVPGVTLLRLLDLDWNPRSASLVLRPLDLDWITPRASWAPTIELADNGLSPAYILVVSQFWQTPTASVSLGEKTANIGLICVFSKEFHLLMSPPEWIPFNHFSSLIR